MTIGQTTGSVTGEATTSQIPMEETSTTGKTKAHKYAKMTVPRTVVTPQRYFLKYQTIISRKYQFRRNFFPMATLTSEIVEP